MADGWDLHAVVSGGATAPTASVPVNSHIMENPLLNFDSLTFANDDSPFCYPDFIYPNFDFQGLEEIYQSFNSPLPLPPPPPPPPHQQQLVHPTQFMNSHPGASLSLPASHSQTVRLKKRKNQQTKLVRQMTHEELLADSWAWRKYGQKPIKGSPYPRNYYRCSTSKGCASRKQVEKSPSDPNIYVVSYIGDHTHPRPTHRNSLAGSTRSKFSYAPPKPTADESSDPPPPSAAATNPSGSSSSQISRSGFSPTTPVMEGERAPPEAVRLSETVEIKNGGDVAEMEEETESYYDEELLIPNAVMSEDILKGFAELRGRFPGSSSSAAFSGGRGF